MGKAIGIDLGTTNSVMAIFNGERAETIENTDGSSFLTPSVVGISTHGERMIGQLAKTQAIMRPRDTIFSIKRFMGRNFRDPDVQRDIDMVPYKVTEAANGEVEVWLDGQPHSPEQISAFILAAMKQDAEEQLGEVTHAVITVPAYFGQRQKDATRTAGRLAGLKVMRIIPEPTAAALAYGIKAQSSEPQTLLVYDLGGGTFDVTVLFVAGGVFAEVAKTGDNHLGGDDFDQAIINHLIAHVQRQHRVDLRGHSEALQKLKAAAENAKIALSKKQRTSIIVPAITPIGSNRLLDVELDMTRQEYENIIRPYVKKTIDLVYQAIKEAEYRAEDIDHILLVGGSTQTPFIVDSLKHEFGDEKILRGVNPMQCVAQGAAVQAAIIPAGEEDPGEHPEIECPHCGKPNPLGQPKCLFCKESLYRSFSGGIPPTLDQNTPKPLGIQTEGDKMEVIVPKGTPYPTDQPKTSYFYTTQANQVFVRVPVFEGFDAEVASQNEFLGVAQGELPPGLPNKTEVAVSFSIDRDGILYVTAQLPERPDVKIEAKIDMEHRQQAASMLRGEAGPGGSPQPPLLKNWQDEAQATLNMAGFILAQGRRYMEPRAVSLLQGLGMELQQAIADNNETLARRKMEAMEQALNNLGPVTLLVFAEAIASSEMVSPAESSRLTALVQQAQRALTTNNMFQFNQVLSELDALMGQIMSRLQAPGEAGPGPTPANMLRGLLRGSR